VNCIRKNLESLGISNICIVKKGKAEKIIEGFGKNEFDLIIADPPYDYPWNKILNILNNIAKSHIMGNDGIIVIEHNNRNSIPEAGGLAVYKERFYGKSVVSYLKVVKEW